MNRNRSEVTPIKILNYIKSHGFAVAVLVWAIFVTAVLLCAPPSTTSEEVPAPSPEIITVREEVIVTAPVENQAHYKEISLTDDEWFWLGQLIYAEAGNQTDLGKRAVVEVVFNRCLDPRFPDAVADVIFAPHQFTDASWVDAQTAAAQYPIIEMVLLEEYPALRDDVVFFATYVANGTLYEQIGAHYFCY